MKIVQKEITVKFNTPAFLGDAEQKGRWRTPPFKALLRQWWRVVVAKDFKYNYVKLREQEGALFGHAWLKKEDQKIWAMKSQVQIALSEWKVGSKNSWQFQGNVYHPEVGQQGRQVDASLYLGYGPLTYNNQIRRTELKSKPAVEEDSSCLLTLMYPDQQEATMCNLLDLLQFFGAIGGRSRNGWGSFNLEGDGVAIPDKLFEIHEWFETYSRDMQECLQKDWPHALGRDDKGLLCWITEPEKGWKSVIEKLAKLKVSFRTALSITKNKDVTNPQVDNRHILAYPITNHGVKGWCEEDDHGNLLTDRHGHLKQKERNANQLRFKVVRLKESKFMGVIFHLPCCVPEELTAKLGRQDRDFIHQKQVNTWKKVHAELDHPKHKLTRIS